MIGPKNEPVAFATSGDPEHVTVDVQQTALPGFYRFKIGDQTVGQAALNVDPRESNLERIDRESLLRCFDMSGTRSAVQSAEGWEPLANLRGRPLWGWCLASTMAAFGIEMLLLGYWKR